jgi:hypothetical protein
MRLATASFYRLLRCLAWASRGAVVLILAGCASSHVIIGTVRPAISPDQVKIYLHPPAKYEEVAVIDATSRGHPAFTDQQKMDTAIARLKSEAAKLGANGILLEGTGDQQAGSVGVGSATASGHTAVGFGTSAGIFNKAANGIAIYVEP